MPELSEKVRELRKVMGWTQEDLARQVPVSLPTVQRWERGRPLRGLAAKRALERLFKRAGIDHDGTGQGKNSDSA